MKRHCCHNIITTAETLYPLTGLVTLKIILCISLVSLFLKYPCTRFEAETCISPTFQETVGSHLKRCFKTYYPIGWIMSLPSNERVSSKITSKCGRALAKQRAIKTDKKLKGNKHIPNAFFIFCSFVFFFCLIFFSNDGV